CAKQRDVTVAVADVQLYRHSQAYRLPQDVLQQERVVNSPSTELAITRIPFVECCSHVISGRCFRSYVESESIRDNRLEPDGGLGCLLEAGSKRSHERFHTRLGCNALSDG